MSWMYILQNSETGRFYIGSTINIKRRLKEHISGKTRTTRVFKTYNLVYKEYFDSIEEARSRERKLKSYKSKSYINWLINLRP